MDNTIDYGEFNDVELEILEVLQHINDDKQEQEQNRAKANRERRVVVLQQKRAASRAGSTNTTSSDRSTPRHTDTRSPAFFAGNGDEQQPHKRPRTKEDRRKANRESAQRHRDGINQRLEEQANTICAQENTIQEQAQVINELKARVRYLDALVAEQHQPKL